MSPRFVLGRKNVPCVAEVVNRSLKADCTDFNCNSIKKICFLENWQLFMGDQFTFNSNVDKSSCCNDRGLLSTINMSGTVLEKLLNKWDLRVKFRPRLSEMLDSKSQILPFRAGQLALLFTVLRYVVLC